MCQVWCSGVQGIYAQLLGIQSAIDPCYTVTPPLPINHGSMLHCYTSPCQATIDLCNTITPHKSICWQYRCAFSYM